MAKKFLDETGVETLWGLADSKFVSKASTETISGSKTFTGSVVTSNNKFEIKANSNTDDSWIKLTNATDAGYYAFGIRRPYDSYGLQLKIHPASGSDSYYDIWHAGNDGSGSGLDADFLDGKHASSFASTSVATSSANGLMSSNDKKALDAISTTYATKSELENLTIGATKVFVDFAGEDLNTFLDDADTRITNLENGNFATKNELSQSIETLESDIASDYAKKSSITNMVTSDNNFSSGGLITTTVNGGKKIQSSGKSIVTSITGSANVPTDGAVKTYVDNKVSGLIDSAPGTLDTLNELAAALGDDPNFATTVATQIGNKADDSAVVHKTGAETISGVKTFSAQQKFTVANGTAPFTVSSTTKVSNLNADMVDGFSFTTSGYQYQKYATLSLKRDQLINSNDYIYVKMTCSNKYLSQQLRFKVVPGYDNVAGSTEVTTYSRQQNAFYLDSVYYNGNKFIGIYQPSANTDVYYLKFNKFLGNYTSQPNNGSITVYSQDSTLTLTLIESGHSEYATVSAYSYIAVPDNGIYTTYLWNSITPKTNNTYDLGSSSYKWKNIHGVTIYENGTSLASKYQPLDADLTSIAGLTGTSGLLKKTAANTWSLDTSTYLTAESDTLQTVTDRGATTNKSITTAGLTTNSTLYITGTTGHREGIRISPYSGLSSIWLNATGTQDYTTGQMWGITAYLPTYSTDTSKQNTFRFRGPSSSTSTSAIDQMWINTSGLVTSRGGFAKDGSNNNYILLAGGGTKLISDFASATPDYVKIDIASSQSTTSGTLTSAQLTALKNSPHKTVLNWAGFYCFAENLSGGSTWYYSATPTFGTASIDKKVISVNTTTGTWSYSNYKYEDKNTTYSAATSSALGLVKSSTTGTTANRDYNVQVNSDGTMKVNVPWTNTTYGIATTSTAGLVKPGMVNNNTITMNSTTSTSGRYYVVEMNSAGSMFVNVPWTNTTYSAATSSVLGLVKSSTTGTTANRDYNVQVNSDGTMKVNVPWTNTTYSFSNKAATLSWDTTSTIATVGGTDITVKLPANPNTDTKVTNTVNTTTKYYVTGTTSASTSTGTQVYDTGVYVGSTAGALHANTVNLDTNATMKYDSTNQCIRFIIN